MAKEHYAIRLKKENARLREIVYDYYEAVYEAQDAVRDRNGLQSVPVFCGRLCTAGNEERMPVRDYEEVCKIIEGLPQVTP